MKQNRSPLEVLRAELDSQGLFQVSRRQRLFVHVRIVLAYILGMGGVLYGVQSSQAFTVGIFAALLFFAILDLFWWLHDVGHQSIYSSRRLARVLVDVGGILFLGMPQSFFHFSVHRRHHSFTNVVGQDPALETGPIHWNVSRELSSRRNGWQPWAWFLGIAPLSYVLLTLLPSKN